MASHNNRLLLLLGCLVYGVFFELTASQILLRIRGFSSRSLFDEGLPEVQPPPPTSGTQRPLVYQQHSPPEEYPAHNIHQPNAQGDVQTPYISNRSNQPSQAAWNGHSTAYDQPNLASSATAGQPVLPGSNLAKNPSNNQRGPIQSTWHNDQSGTQNSVASSQLPAIASSSQIPPQGGQGRETLPPTTTASHSAPSPSHPVQNNFMEKFSGNLFQKIWPSSSNQNIVYSPISIHTLMGLIYGASSGETAAELAKAAQFNQNSREDIASKFFDLMSSQQRTTKVQFIMANKVYYNAKLGALNPGYRNFAVSNYNAEIEPMNFKNAAASTNRINAWASDSTMGRIPELVAPGDIDDKTEAVLVSAIYFKARWANEFSAMDTMPFQFRRGNKAPINVNMMYNDDVFRYADLHDLDAKALELAYAGTNATMLILLPNKVDGLQELERNLGSRQLNEIANMLKPETVTVRLPRFRIEYEQDMGVPLRQLNVNKMFSDQSELDAMLMDPVKISKILQKATIDVNEAGSEAAAATYAKFVPLSLPVKVREFTADHPFMYAIRTPQAVLFIGHVLKPTPVSSTS